MAPMSAGEFIDRITILKIKVVRLSDEAARQAARAELDLHLAEFSQVARLDLDMVDRLLGVNLRLWDLENKIRIALSSNDRPAVIVNLVKRIHAMNAKRWKIKHEIDLDTGSPIVEQKEYAK